MTGLSPVFLSKIAHLLEEEENEIYTLTLYYLDKEDLKYFNKEISNKVKRIFEILIDDSKKHAELLRLMLALGDQHVG